MATAVSAAAMAMPNRLKKWPSSCPGKKITVEYREIDVGCIKHQFYRNQQSQQVFAGKESVDAAKQHDGTDDEVVNYMNFYFHNLTVLFLFTCNQYRTNHTS